MTETVDKKPIQHSPQPRILKPWGWTIRVLSLCALLVGCALLASFLYQDVIGSPSIVEEPESLPVTTPTKEVDDKVESPVPESSITSSISQEMIDQAEHPLDPLLEMAKRGASIVEKNVFDYTANITKQVRWKGKLQPESQVACKIRHQRDAKENQPFVPFSVYTLFVYPKKGQEAIWVDGWNDGNLLAHGPPGLLNLMSVSLDPNGSMAMNGNRYPVTDIGMLNLIKKMIEKGTQDRKYPDCTVKMTRNVMLGDARCTCFEIVHEEESKDFEFHRAEIYIDDDRNLPIAFNSYLWPDEPGGKPKLLERYYYTNIQVNVGLKDADFDPANDDYQFPGY